MQAIQLHAFGGPEVLRYEAAPIPALKPGEVLVRVHAIGLNPPDWYLRDGYQMLPPEWRPVVAFPLIPGSDVPGFAAGDGCVSSSCAGRWASGGHLLQPEKKHGGFGVPELRRFKQLQSVLKLTF